MCVRGLLPPGRALPAPALRACGLPGPIMSRLPPRPQPIRKGRRPWAPAWRGREGTRRARPPVPAAQALPRGDAGVRVGERSRRPPFPPWALGSSASSPLPQMGPSEARSRMRARQGVVLAHRRPTRPPRSRGRGPAVRRPGTGHLPH